MIALLVSGIIWRQKMGTQSSLGDKDNNPIHFYRIYHFMKYFHIYLI